MDAGNGGVGATRSCRGASAADLSRAAAAAFWLYSEFVYAGELASAGGWMSRLRDLAEQLAASAPHALRGILDAIIVGGECGLQQGLDYETQAFAVCASTEDMCEGTAAFLERRKPTFSGR